MSLLQRFRLGMPYAHRRLQVRSLRSLQLFRRQFCQLSADRSLKGSTWLGRISEILWRESRQEAAQLTEREFCASRGLMVPEIAQGTQPVVLKQFLAPTEVDSLVRRIEEVQRQGVAGKRIRNDGFGAQMISGCWQTTYLHTDSIFKTHFPDIQEKILQALFKADAEHWRVLPHREVSKLNLRTVEFHEYVPPGQLAGEAHFDAGSLITFDLYLAEPGIDFTGGDLVMREADGSLCAPVVRRGDVVLFISHKYHHVQPILSGKRVVLVAEIWEGPERTCAHRCTSHEACSFR